MSWKEKTISTKEKDKIDLLSGLFINPYFCSDKWIKNITFVHNV